MPKKNRYQVTGLMSGSSLDGTDLAFVTFTLHGGKWTFRLLHGTTIPYPGPLREELATALSKEPESWADLDHRLGSYYAGLLNGFHHKLGIMPDLVASHGHTIAHDPSQKLTFQAGHGPTMARNTGLRVINRFRNADVEQGGQGAPLVPVGDRHLFGEYDACLNLGGFANISYENRDGHRLAFDIGPANMALNYLAGKAGMEMDVDGIMAAQGKVNPGLLSRMNSLPYYTQKGPKSLGKEWFEEHFIPLLDAPSHYLPDLMATTVQHIAQQCGQVLREIKAEEILVTGGGAHHLNLMTRIGSYMGKSIPLPPDKLIHYKEALVFAFLGVLRDRHEINCLSSVTGGLKDLCCGDIHEPK